jgi:hypothetical protein
MSGAKQTPAKSHGHGKRAASQALTPHSVLTPQIEKPPRKAQFGQASVYRQGVLVVGASLKSLAPRSRNR